MWLQLLTEVLTQCSYNNLTINRAFKRRGINKKNKKTKTTYCSQDLNEALCIRISPPYSYLYFTARVQFSVQSGRYTEKENGAETKSTTPKPSLLGVNCGIKS